MILLFLAIFSPVSAAFTKVFEKEIFTDNLAFESTYAIMAMAIFYFIYLAAMFLTIIFNNYSKLTKEQKFVRLKREIVLSRLPFTDIFNDDSKTAVLREFGDQDEKDKIEKYKIMDMKDRVVGLNLLRKSSEIKETITREGFSIGMILKQIEKYRRNKVFLDRAILNIYPIPKKGKAPINQLNAKASMLDHNKQNFQGQLQEFMTKLNTGKIDVKQSVNSRSASPSSISDSKSEKSFISNKFNEGECAKSACLTRNSRLL